MRFYAAYKNTGIPWLGNVPNHWDVLRLGSMLKERGEVNRGRKTENILSVMRDVGVINYEDKGNVGNKKSENTERYKIVYEGDIVVNSMNVIIGSVGIAKEDGALSPIYLVFKASDDTVSTKYYNYVFMAKPFQRSLVRIGYGILDHRMRIPVTLLRQELLPKPPRYEQDVIVSYLDSKVSDIDLYIAEKNHLIELLQEQKKALIDKVITFGLNPKVKMKTSRLEWLTGIPEHWKTIKIRHLIKGIDQGDSPVCDNYLADNEHWGVLKAGCANDGIFNELEHKQLPHETPFDKKNQVQIGDVLMSRASGSPRLVGSVARVYSLSHKLLLSDKTFRLNFKNLKHVDFIVYAMNSTYLRKQIETEISGAEGLANNISKPSIKDLVVAIPPDEEAQKITDWISKLNQEMDFLISNIEAQVELIKEYRTTLITEAVTGKIDVRAIHE